MHLQIRCISKQPRHDPTERIIRVGGLNPDGSHWRLSLNDAIRGVENRTYDFFVSTNSRHVDVIVGVSRSGRKYLRTVGDDYEPNNLLSLPECP